MLREIRLHQDGACKSAPAGAPGDLGKQLKGAFGCAEIGKPELRVGGSHSHKRAALEVVPLGKYLGAHKDIPAAWRKGVQHVLKGSFAAGRIAVQPGDARFGKKSAQA